MSPSRPALANPRRTTLALLRSGSRCEIGGPTCRGTALRLVSTEGGERPACSACATG